MKRQPWMKFYPADWRADPALRACSPISRGIWLDMIGLMHEAEPYGYLLINGAAPSIKALSGLVNVHHKTLIAALKDLSEHGVYSATDEGVIYSRRMVRDHQKAIQDQENGRRGGNPHIKPPDPKGVNPRLNGEDKAQKPEARSQSKTPSLRSGVSAQKRASKTPISLDAKLSIEGRAYATSHGILNGSADAVWEHFRDHHYANGNRFTDWDAAWRNWVRNQGRFGAPKQNRESTADIIDRVFAEQQEAKRNG